MRHFSLQLKITLFLLTLFVIALVNTSVVYLLDNDNEKRVEFINHNYQQVLMVEKLLSHMKDSETGQRGYLITHDT
ncbi:MAG TPA: diguanylate cyclase, partial [Piscirickettsiaceae bacterium]|nr:diguanylate cyclase [Piscirickettsiaceae bacterium]